MFRGYEKHLGRESAGGLNETTPYPLSPTLLYEKNMMGVQRLKDPETNFEPI